MVREEKVYMYYCKARKTKVSEADCYVCFTSHKLENQLKDYSKCRKVNLILISEMKKITE